MADVSDSQGKAAPGSGRLLSLDVFRGVTILAMILVNNPGSWGAMYWPLAHADWHGWTPTDLIFPFFLFIVGTALAYSLRKYVAAPGDSPGARFGGELSAAVYWRIVRRTALLIFLGWFPGLLFRFIGYLNGDANALDLSTLRLPGVLVRIGIVYFCASMIVLHLSVRAQVVLGAALLLGYWGLLAFFPSGDYAANLTNDGNVVGLVDRAVLGLDHMYRAGGATDPEGLLSTLPAVVTALLGYWTGLFIQRRGVSYRTVGQLASIGAVCVLIALAWHYAFPINKKIWTSSFVMLTGGLAMMMLAGCLLKFDLWGWRRLGRAYEVVGVNAILVFVGSGLLATTLTKVQIGGVTAKDWLFGKITDAVTDPAVVNVVGEWIAEPKFASLCYSLGFVAFWWLVCWLMWRMGWQLRV